MTIARLFRIVVLVLLPLSISWTLDAQRSSVQDRWVTGWSTSQQGAAEPTITNATLRVIARVTIPGAGVRIRLANTFGKAPVTIGRVFVGHRVLTATLVPGSNKQVLFKGSGSVTIPPGGDVTSDPVTMQVLAMQDLAISLYIPGANVPPSQHGAAFVTSYITANNAGDIAADEVHFAPGVMITGTGPFSGTMTSTPLLKAVDVLSTNATGAIVAFGDSITDGWCSTVDGYDRWPDWLAIRLNLAGNVKAVLNEGIGGNTVTRILRPAVNSDPGVERLERDVLLHSGVTHVVLFEGTNDLRREVTPAQLIAGMQDIITRVKARGIKIIGATIIPRHNYPPDQPDERGNSGWNDAKSVRRREVNDWIRTRAGFDGVIDFDKVVRDPANPDLNQPALVCDGIHPSARGYYSMGQAIPLSLFQGDVKKASTDTASLGRN